MQIMFTEDRELLDGTRIKAGEVREFADEEAQHFINNGVAKAAAPESKKGK